MCARARAIESLLVARARVRTPETRARGDGHAATAHARTLARARGIRQGGGIGEVADGSARRARARPGIAAARARAVVTTSTTWLVVRARVSVHVAHSTRARTRLWVSICGVKQGGGGHWFSGRARARAPQKHPILNKNWVHSKTLKVAEKPGKLSLSDLVFCMMPSWNRTKRITQSCQKASLPAHTFADLQFLKTFIKKKVFFFKENHGKWVSPFYVFCN